ncbi:MAG: hypothetical protein IPI51_15715 [Betaproteobacteria bacterium]|nr:hypothetical protein [Betaproteobacteria bacterium]
MMFTARAGVLTGAELRYLRTAGMLLSQPALGKRMGADGQSVCTLGEDQQSAAMGRQVGALVGRCSTPKATFPSSVPSSASDRRAADQPAHRCRGIGQAAGGPVLTTPPKAKELTAA